MGMPIREEINTKLTVNTMTEVQSTFKSTDFEHEVMLCLLEDETPMYEELRYQYRHASILRREKSKFSRSLEKNHSFTFDQKGKKFPV